MEALAQALSGAIDRETRAASPGAKRSVDLGARVIISAAEPGPGTRVLPRTPRGPLGRTRMSLHSQPVVPVPTPTPTRLPTLVPPPIVVHPRPLPAKWATVQAPPTRTTRRRRRQKTNWWAFVLVGAIVGIATGAAALTLLMDTPVQLLVGTR
jgi:hypothetical protein